MSTETTPTAEPWDVALSLIHDNNEYLRPLKISRRIQDACLAYAAQQTEVFRANYLAETCKQTKEILELRAQLTADKSALEESRPLLKRLLAEGNTNAG